ARVALARLVRRTICRIVPRADRALGALNDPVLSKSGYVTLFTLALGFVSAVNIPVTDSYFHCCAPLKIDRSRPLGFTVLVNDSHNESHCFYNYCTARIS